VFIINELKHPDFKREGNNLSTEIWITLKEALLGFEKAITHLDGRQISIERDEVTQPGYIIKMIGEGMPIHQKGGDTGDLYVKINVIFPQELTEKQRLIADRLFNKRTSW